MSLATAVAGVDVGWSCYRRHRGGSHGSIERLGHIGSDGNAGRHGRAPISIVATANGSDRITPNLFGHSDRTAASAPSATNANVSVTNNQFTPASLTISAGTTVVWTWASTAQNHNVAPAASQPTRSGNPRERPCDLPVQVRHPRHLRVFLRGARLGAWRHARNDHGAVVG